MEEKTKKQKKWGMKELQITMQRKVKYPNREVEFRLTDKSFSFLSLLFKTIAKSDNHNREKLRQTYPEEVQSYERYLLGY